MFNLISLLLANVDTIQVIDPGHHFAELSDISSGYKKVSIEDKRIVPVYVVSHLTLRSVAFNQRSPTEQAISLININMR